MAIEIAQIQNAALKAAALGVDQSATKNGYIDACEMNIFKDKAQALLNEQKCTAEEFDALFATSKVDRRDSTDMFEKLDSIHYAKNTPEALAKEAEEAKQAEKQEKIKQLEAEIADNDNKLKLIEERLAQKEVSWFDYQKDTSDWNKILGDIMLGGTCVGLGATAGGMLFLLTESMAAGILATGGMALIGVWQPSPRDCPPRRQCSPHTALRECSASSSSPHPALTSHYC